MTYRHKKGLSGEKIAAEYLETQGFRILQHRYRFGHKEIDLIAEKDGLVVFIEVKNRRNEDFSPVELSIPDKKKQNLVEAAQGYIYETGCENHYQEYRFDVIFLITPGKAGEFQLKHIKDAFRV